LDWPSDDEEDSLMLTLVVAVEVLEPDGRWKHGLPALSCESFGLTAGGDRNLIANQWLYFRLSEQAAAR
jgi:hypothetical protein